MSKQLCRTVWIWRLNVFFWLSSPPDLNASSIKEETLKSRSVPTYVRRWGLRALGSVSSTLTIRLLWFLPRWNLPDLFLLFSRGSSQCSIVEYAGISVRIWFAEIRSSRYLGTWFCPVILTRQVRDGDRLRGVGNLRTRVLFRISTSASFGYQECHTIKNWLWNLRM